MLGEWRLGCHETRRRAAAPFVDESRTGGARGDIVGVRGGPAGRGAAGGLGLGVWGLHWVAVGVRTCRREARVRHVTLCAGGVVQAGVAVRGRHGGGGGTLWPGVVTRGGRLEHVSEANLLHHSLRHQLKHNELH